MNRKNLVKAAAKRSQLTPEVVEGALTGLLQEIEHQLHLGNDVTLMHFGTFFVTKRKGGAFFNPHTKERGKVPDMKLAKFRSGKGLREKINSRTSKS